MKIFREASAWAKGEVDIDFNYFPYPDQPETPEQELERRWNEHLPECPQREYKFSVCTCDNP